jgi:shikimate dehydrogenase
MNTPALSARQAFVIGWPIKHSRSPLIHTYWLRKLGLIGTYDKHEVRPEELGEFLGHLEEKGFLGGNVTLPHKEQAFALCKRRTETAERLGAVNTLWIEDGQLCGDNTDVAGFLACLDDEAPHWQQNRETAVILGAGGAARAIVYALLLRGWRRIVLVNRTRAKSEALSEDLARHFNSDIVLCDWGDLPQVLEKADLLVNTTSLGMAGQPALSVDIAPLPRHATVSDIVYVPLETELVRKARARGLVAAGGLGMLLHQAVPGFQKWFGKRPDVTAELRALVEADVTGASVEKPSAEKT